MSDTAQFQVYIYACPQNQRAAAAEVLAGFTEWGWTEPDGGHRYLVTHDTKNTDGNPIKAGQAPLTIGDFPDQATAEQFISLQANPDDYSWDEVPGVDLETGYTAYEASCGTADEVSEALIAAAPGCSFVLWENPSYQWLGTVVARTPELGYFSGDCDADGTPVFDRDQIIEMIGKAREAGEDLAEHIHKATGGPWFDDWRASDKAATA